MTVAELFARIGLKTDEDKAKSFSNALKGVRTGLIAVTGIAAGTSVAIKKITTDAMNAAAAFTQFETETGASAQELQKWQAVALQTNQSAESVTNAIKSIADNQAKIKLGQGNISGYQLLGIDPNQDPFKVLEDLRTATEGFSQEQKKNALSMMGVGTGLLQTLELTRGEFDAMASRAFIISPQAIDTLNKTKSSVDLAGRAIKYIKAQIAVGLSPQIKETTKRFSEWVKVNEEGIIKGFQKAYTFVEKFVGALTNTATVINTLVTGTLGWERTIKLAAVAFGVLNAVMMASPIGLITAGIILLVAVLDDLYIYSKGGKSMFGKLMEEFPGLEQGLFGFVDKMKEFGGWIQDAIDKIKELKALFFGKEYDLEAAAERTAARVESVGGYPEFTKDPGKFAADVNKAMGLYSGAEAALGAPIVNIDQNIYGSGDPIATGNAAANLLQRELNAASAQRSFNE